MEYTAKQIEEMRKLIEEMYRDFVSGWIANEARAADINRNQYEKRMAKILGIKK